MRVMNPTWRIAVVTETYPPDVNGVARTLSRVVQGLRERGHEVMLVRPRGPSDRQLVASASDADLLVRGIPIPMYPELRMGSPAGRSLRRLWIERRPDVVHIASEGPLGWSAVRTARRMKIPSTSDFRTNFHAYSRFYGMGWLQSAVLAYLRRFHNGTARTMVPTDQLRNELEGFGFERLHVVRRGVDTRFFSPQWRSSELRASWGAGESTPVMLSVGRLAAEKNLSVVVKAYQAARQAGLDLRLVFVGDGPLRDVLRHGCPEAIFMGTCQGELLQACYASADMFIFPSLTETFGNVTLEAMASGLAVVSYRCAAAAEIITNDADGVLVAPGAAEDMTAAVVKLLRQPEVIRTMGHAARRVACSQEWEQVVMHTEQVLAAAIGSAMGHATGSRGVLGISA
jgi:glycosyltransferase involved in cell wall biosynthesis